MTRPVRVASLVEKLTVGGDENRLLALVRSLDPRRVDHVVIVICPIDRDDPRQRLIHDAYLEAGAELIVLATTPPCCGPPPAPVAARRGRQKPGSA